MAFCNKLARFNTGLFNPFYYVITPALLINCLRFTTVLAYLRNKENGKSTFTGYYIFRCIYTYKTFFDMKTKRIIGLIMLCFALLTPVIYDKLTPKGQEIFKHLIISLGCISFCFIAIMLLLIDEFYE